MATRREGRHLSLPEAARRLGLHRATVNEMVQDGRIPAERNGPHWYVDEVDLDAFAATYTRPPGSPRRRVGAVEPSGDLLARLADWEEASVRELAAVINMHEGNIRKHLCIAEAQGLAERDEYAQWRLTAAGRAKFHPGV